MAPRSPESLPDRVRAACAWVAGEAYSVRIVESAIAAYARDLSSTPEPPPDPRIQLLEGDRETLAAFAICLNAINFGSGWWPTIEKRPGLSGYSTIAAGVVDRFRSEGAWSAAELTSLGAAAVAATLSQDPDHPLMEQFAASLRDVGDHVLADHDGRFEAVVDAAKGSAVALAELLAGWEAFADASMYRGREVPFFKRAQLAAADLDRGGVADFPDRARLTAFADNLVPHVLRVCGILRLDPALKGKLEAEELLEHDSPGEIELRACAVHTVELLCAATTLSSPEIDSILWNLGRERRYKSLPRPRSRNTAY
jgi:putative queuosine salvage protein